MQSPLAGLFRKRGMSWGPSQRFREQDRPRGSLFQEVEMAVQIRVALGRATLVLNTESPKEAFETIPF